MKYDGIIVYILSKRNQKGEGNGYDIIPVLVVCHSPFLIHAFCIMNIIVLINISYALLSANNSIPLVSSLGTAAILHDTYVYITETIKFWRILVPNTPPHIYFTVWMPVSDDMTECYFKFKTIHALYRKRGLIWWQMLMMMMAWDFLHMWCLNYMHSLYVCMNAWVRKRLKIANMWGSYIHLELYLYVAEGLMPFEILYMLHYIYFFSFSIPNGMNWSLF